MDDADVFAGFVVLLVLVAIYLIPTIVAICRRAYYSAAAITINILFGWTFVGWLLALVLALLNKPDRMPQQIVIQQVVGDKNTFPESNKTKEQE